MDSAQYVLMCQMEDRHWWYLGMRLAVSSMLQAHHIDMRTCRWLDAGCGTGGNLAALGDTRSTGVDVSPLALMFCRGRGVARLACASVEALPCASDCFDLITSFEVLYHRGVASDRLALTEFFRVLRPGGYLLVRLPAYDRLRGRHDTAVHTARRYRLWQLGHMLEGAGFEVVQISYLNTVLLVPAVVKRLLETIHTPGMREDLDLPHPLLNRLFTALLGYEGRFVAAGHRLPAGLSVLALAKRPAVGHRTSRELL